MIEANDWFGNWNALADTVVLATLFYIFIVILVRTVGKRMTAQLNNFDWIINITVGSLAASGIMLDNVPAVRALAAITTLAVCQWALTALVRKSAFMARLVKESPTLLLEKGAMLEDALSNSRVSEEEVWAALRANGMTNCDEANWVILETNGDMTVIPRSEHNFGEAATMENVSRA